MRVLLRKAKEAEVVAGEVMLEPGWVDRLRAPPPAPVAVLAEAVGKRRRHGLLRSRACREEELRHKAIQAGQSLEARAHVAPARGAEMTL